MIANKLTPKVVAVVMALLVCLCFCAMGYAGAHKSPVEDSIVTAADLDDSYDSDRACRITLTGGGASVSGAGAAASGGTVVIDRAGTYLVSGALTDGMILVDAANRGTIQLVLAGADISNSASAAIYVRKAEKVVLTAAPGTENSLSNTGGYTPIDENNIDAVVFSKDDLTLNGAGLLKIAAAEGHAVVSKDDLIVTGGRYEITAGGQGLSAKENLVVSGGVFTVDTTGDTIHSDGDLSLLGGEFDLRTKDDGVHAGEELTVSGGVITVSESYEGLEGKTISIRGGEISVTASDDGLNASDGTGGEFGFGAASDARIDISGGTLYVNAGGDGLDSNGTFAMSGGRVQVDGPTTNYDSSLDYETEAVITGGVFLSVGSSGMAENFGGASTQGSIMLTVSGSAGDTVSLTDQQGKELVSFQAAKNYSSVLVSCPEILLNGTYTLTAGDTVTEVTTDSIVYGSGFGGLGGFGGFGGKGDFGGFGKGGFGGKDFSQKAAPKTSGTSLTDGALTTQNMNFGNTVPQQGGQKPQGGGPQGMGPGGGRPDGMPNGQPSDGQLPDGFDPSDFDPSQFGGQLPDGFDPSDFDPSQFGGEPPADLPDPAPGTDQADGQPSDGQSQNNGMDRPQWDPTQMQGRPGMEPGGADVQVTRAAGNHFLVYGVCLAVGLAALLFASLYKRRSVRR